MLRRAQPAAIGSLQKMRWPLLISLLIGSVVGVSLKGTFGHGIWNGLGLMFVLAPLALIFFSMVLVDFLETKKFTKPKKILGRITFCVGIFLIASEVTGLATYKVLNWRAKKFGEQLLTKIEQYEAENGRLPESIFLVEQRTPPYPMKEWCYNPSGGEFLISYPDTRDLKGAPISLSRSRQWISFYERDWDDHENKPTDAEQEATGQSTTAE